jgi:hypothetical protein
MLAGQVGFISSVALNFDPVDFLERKFFASEIVEFGSFAAIHEFISESLSMFQRAAILG